MELFYSEFLIAKKCGKCNCMKQIDEFRNSGNWEYCRDCGGENKTRKYCVLLFSNEIPNVRYYKRRKNSHIC